MADRVLPPETDKPGLTVRTVVDAMEALYPARLAAPWDSVGLVAGRLDSPVSTILLAVDATERTALEAIHRGADMLITHHPLFLTGVSSVAAVDARGRLVHAFISSDVALFTAHTNADCASAGVSDALAGAVGLRDLQPLDDSGDPGEGLGRVGVLGSPMRLGDFAQVVASALPRTSRGVNVAGDLMSMVERVAVCGGSGDSLLAAATAAGADVFVTADLKHHRTLDHIADGGCAVIDVAHWASEWPWLVSCQHALQRALTSVHGGDAVDILVSTDCTDPWTAHYQSPEST